jgi:hypothetical protein
MIGHGVDETLGCAIVRRAIGENADAVERLDHHLARSARGGGRVHLDVAEHERVSAIPGRE